MDLLLTDVTMPGMDGQELAHKLTEKQPSLKVILMSGFSHMQIALKCGWKFIRKPFRPTAVKATIEKLLYCRSMPSWMGK